MKAIDEPNKYLRLLMVEDSEDDAELLLHHLKRANYKVAFVRVETPAGMHEALRNQSWDIIVADWSLPHFSGLAAMAVLKETGLDVPFILVSGKIGEEAAVAAMKAGANDFVPKSNRSRLIPCIERELREAESRRARKLAEERVQNQLLRLNSLRAIESAITASLDLPVILRSIVTELTTQLHADAAAILLLDPATQTLEYATGRGFKPSGAGSLDVTLGAGCRGRAAAERRTIRIRDISEAPREFAREMPKGEKFAAYYAAPLVARGDLKGYLEIYHRTPLSLDQEWLDFLEALATTAAIGIDNAKLIQDLQRSNAELRQAYEATLQSWVRALDLRAREREGHSERVTEMSVRLASSMGIFGAELEHIRRGAMLHDIGKIAVSDSILHKKGALTAEERATLELYPTHAYELLSPIEHLQPAIDIPYCHHEKWDGTGYPRGLKAYEIPLAARIFAVVEVWDALRMPRPGGAGWPEARVYEYLREQAGSFFDPNVVEAFFRMMASAEHPPELTAHRNGKNHEGLIPVELPEHQESYVI
jgi:response regulator RpfG family c-di-GMP phosphodiesterase